jgi:RNA polymerase sigma factor (sigma-70 family)
MTEEYLSDPDLIAAVRAGDTAAYEALYRRHVEAARRMARTLARGPADVDDLVAEAFAKLLATLSAGGGPDTAFRPYLLTTIRRLFYDRARRDRREPVTDDPALHDPGVPFVDTAVQGMEYAFVARAFARLPERWQAVLWHTEVEGGNPATVAPLLGLTPNGVAALAYRARERLRQHYLQEHLAAEPADECRWAIERLGAHVRGGLSRRDGRRVDDHLTGCRRCHLLFVELTEVNAGMREALAGALLAGSSSVYLAGTSAAGGSFAGFLGRIARRRSTQVAAGGAVVAAGLVVIAMLLSGQSTPVAVPPPSPSVAFPSSAPSPLAPSPSVASPLVPSPTFASPLVRPSPSPATAALDARLEPVGTLVRGRPGVLALTVVHSGRTGGSGGWAAPTPVPETGPLTAELSLPRGVSLRAGPAGDGWRCAAARCGRPSLRPGRTTRAYLPVTVSATAAEGNPGVRLTAPHAAATRAVATAGVRGSGLAAIVAGTIPATVAVGGNSLLSCGDLCDSAREGRREADNGDYRMTRYADPSAPPGYPYGSAVSGAAIAVPGRVVWAGLYWAGTGAPPDAPAARLLVPGTDRYATVTAGRVDRVAHDDFEGAAYQASADVTQLVRGSRGGTWWVAVDGDAFERGYNAFGGWALLLIVDGGGPPRTVAVFDGLTPLPRDSTFSSPVWGAGGAATVGLVAWEGDRKLTGERITLGGRPLGDSDIAGSHADGTPAGWHTFGTDARRLTAHLPTPTAPLTATTTADAWLLGPVALITD